MNQKVTLKRALDDIVAILGREPSLVGIGSLAPLARNGSKHTVIDVLLTARQLSPKMLKTYQKRGIIWENLSYEGSI